MDILLDGMKIKSKEELFSFLKKEINSHDFHGNNLDALWDVLSYPNLVVNIKIINFKSLEESLGSYAVKLKELLNDLKALNAENRIVIND